MRDGQVDLPLRLPEDAAVGLRQQVNPAVLELAAVVVRDRDLLLLERAVARQDAHFNEDLEAVADAQYELAVVDKTPDRVGQVMHDLVGKNPPGGDVVAIA